MFFLLEKYLNNKVYNIGMIKNVNSQMRLKLSKENLKSAKKGISVMEKKLKLVRKQLINAEKKINNKNIDKFFNLINKDLNKLIKAEKVINKL